MSKIKGLRKEWYSLLKFAESEGMTKRKAAILELKCLTSRDEEENWNVLKELLSRQAKKIETENIKERLNTIYDPNKSKVDFKTIEGKLTPEEGVYKFEIKDQLNSKKIWSTTVNIKSMIPHELGQFILPGSSQRYFIPDLTIEFKGEEKSLRTILNSQSTFDYCRKPIIKSQQQYQMINLQQIYISHHCQMVMLRVTRGEIKVSIIAKTYKNGTNSRFQTTFTSDKVQKSTNVARLGAHVYHQYIGWNPEVDSLKMETHHIDGQNSNDAILNSSNLILLPQKFHRLNVHNLHDIIDCDVLFTYSPSGFFSIYDLLSILLYMINVEPKTPNDMAMSTILVEEVA